jgi:hypothetical protein
MSVSLLKLQRTIHAKLVLDRKGKREAIAREYWTWQRLLRGLGGQRLYSATRQKADRFRRRMCKQNGHGIEQREYAMILRRDCVKIQIDSLLGLRRSAGKARIIKRWKHKERGI